MPSTPSIVFAMHSRPRCAKRFHRARPDSFRLWVRTQ